MKDPWKVNKLGEGMLMEISVVRSSFSHGFKSCGWDGPDKLIIWSSGGPCMYDLNTYLKEKMLDLAEEYVNHLNQGGEK